MPISLESESLLCLADAANSLPSAQGRKVHQSTIWRWCSRGVRGVRLEHRRIGTRYFTSREALSRFIDRMAAVPAPTIECEG